MSTRLKKEIERIRNHREEILNEFENVKDILKENFEDNHRKFNLDINKLNPIDIIKLKKFFDIINIRYLINKNIIDFDHKLCFEILRYYLTKKNKSYVLYYFFE
jgi:hypothetical protein